MAFLAVLAGTWYPRTVVLASRPHLILNLRLTTTQELPSVTQLALVAETQSIWSEHVRLRWVNHDSEVDGDAFLPVLVMPREVPSREDQSPWTVGELLRQEGTQAIAIASITGARRIVDESRRFQPFDLPAMHDRRLGIVLGRAVAHEIGHYLLRTNTHSTNGLMRARIQAYELADLRRATFRLDKAAEAHLAALAAAGGLSRDPATTEPFSYAR